MIINNNINNLANDKNFPLSRREIFPPQVGNYREISGKFLLRNILW